MEKNIAVLRELTRKYYELAMKPRNRELLELHRKVNDLEMERPVVLINELPWSEMNVDNQLTVINEEPTLRQVEGWLRRNIFQYTHLPADMILKPYIPVRKIVNIGSMGVEKDEEILATDSANHIVSHDYKDMLATEEAIDQICMPEITYNKETTLKNYEMVANAIGDIIPVKIVGEDYFSIGTWDIISELRGVTPLLMDLIDKPEFTHKMVRKITDVYLYRLSKFEELGLFESDPSSLHCTPIATKALNPLGEDKITRKNVWGRGVAQILASASKEMRHEFDIQYMKETIGQCGLSYYGCCEPLDTMIDIIEEIENVRKISITPWANVNVAAEAINNKYVLASKPNPASVAVEVLDEDALRKEIKEILDASKRNGCNIDIVLKDISTCGHNINNLIRWEQIAMEMVNNY